MGLFEVVAEDLLVLQRAVAVGVHLVGPAHEADVKLRAFTEPGLTHLSFSVADVTATCARVADLGGEVLADTDMGGHAILVRDPDGQILELMPLAPR